MKQTAVEWLVQELCICATEEEMNIIIQAEEMEKKQSQDYAAFCINCDRKNYPIVDFESYLKL